MQICIDPDSQFAVEMVEPLQKAIATWNEFTPMTGGYVDLSQEVPTLFHDFESTALHEVGHALGLGHSNAPLFGFASDFTISTLGMDGDLGIDPGPDMVRGSSDDNRGDDENKHWFFKSSNDPFTVESVVDGGTYSRDLGDLPAGHTFAANANPQVGNLLGAPDTLAVMYSDLISGTEKRTLTHDEVATIRFAAAGIDEVEGTADDYSVLIEYQEELNNDCDYILSFVPMLPMNQLAATFANADPLVGDHHAMDRGLVQFNLQRSWFFSPGPNLMLSKTDGGASVGTGEAFVYSLEASNSGIRDATGVFLRETVPVNTTFNEILSDPLWDCAANSAGSLCSLFAGAIPMDTSSGPFAFAVNIDDPVLPGTTEILNTASVEDDGTNGPELTPADNTVVVATPLLGPDLVLTKTDSGSKAAPGDTISYTLAVSNSGARDGADAMVSEIVPDDTTFNAGASNPLWICSGTSAGSICSYDIASVVIGAPAIEILFAVDVDQPLSPSVTEISNTALVQDDGTQGPDQNPADNLVVELTPILPESLIFEDGFESGDTSSWTLDVEN